MLGVKMGGYIFHRAIPQSWIPVGLGCTSCALFLLPIRTGRHCPLSGTTMLLCESTDHNHPLKIEHYSAAFIWLTPRRDSGLVETCSLIPLCQKQFLCRV
jgi:hypothetical protein